LLKVLQRKYDRKIPTYIVLGDFNVDLETWKNESEDKLIGWDLYPRGDSRSARELRVHPIDYVLVYAPGNIHVSDNGTEAFSPLPLTITRVGDDHTYHLSTKEGHHKNKEAVFNTNDLNMKNPRNSAPLHRNDQFASG
jgi:hypothetical protein